MEFKVRRLQIPLQDYMEGADITVWIDKTCSSPRARFYTVMLYDSSVPPDSCANGIPQHVGYGMGTGLKDACRAAWDCFINKLDGALL